jgi:hypothetical protein
MLCKYSKPGKPKYLMKRHYQLATIRCCSLASSLRCSGDLSRMAINESLQCVRQIAQKMPAIGDLVRLRRPG